MDAPVLDLDDCLLQGVEDLAIGQLVPELAVEALIVSVFPKIEKRGRVELFHQFQGEFISSPYRSATTHCSKRDQIEFNQNP